jgi:hypothetical protein
MTAREGKKINMAEKINAETSMDYFFRHIANIEPNDCVRIEGSPKKLEIVLAGQRMPLDDFIRKSTRLVTLDNFSTRGLNERFIKELGMPTEIAEGFRALYLEALRIWGLVEHEAKPVGIVDKLVVYNGFPNLVDPEEYAKNPNEVYNRVLEQIQTVDPRNIFVQPKNYQRVTLRLHRDFLNKNPVVARVE